MINWILSLSLFEQTVLTVAVAATVVLLVQIFLLLINFYGTDKLNADPENLELYEKIANNDSDMSVSQVRVLSVENIYIFLAFGGWSYFIFKSIVPSFFALCLLGVLIGSFFSVVYSLIYYVVKRKLRKKTKWKKHFYCIVAVAHVLVMS